MLIENKHNNQIYNLVGNGITQSELTNYINQIFKKNLVFNNVSVEDYLTERKAELGDFIGTVIAGIYEGIKEGANDVVSNFELAAGRPHKPTIEMMITFKNSQY